MSEDTGQQVFLSPALACRVRPRPAPRCPGLKSDRLASRAGPRGAGGRQLACPRRRGGRVSEQRSPQAAASCAEGSAAPSTQPGLSAPRTRGDPGAALRGSGVRTARVAPNAGLEVEGPKGGGRVGAGGAAGGAGTRSPGQPHAAAPPDLTPGGMNQRRLRGLGLGADRSHPLAGRGGSVLSPLHPGGGGPIPAFRGQLPHSQPQAAEMGSRAWSRALRAPGVTRSRAKPCGVPWAQAEGRLCCPGAAGGGGGLSE